MLQTAFERHFLFASGATSAVMLPMDVLSSMAVVTLGIVVAGVEATTITLTASSMAVVPPTPLLLVPAARTTRTYSISVNSTLHLLSTLSVPLLVTGAKTASALTAVPTTTTVFLHSSLLTE